MLSRGHIVYGPVDPSDYNDEMQPTMARCPETGKLIVGPRLAVIELLAILPAVNNGQRVFFAGRQEVVTYHESRYRSALEVFKELCIDMAAEIEEARYRWGLSLLSTERDDVDSWHMPEQETCRQFETNFGG